MHTVIGYSWGEIASIVAVISVVFSGIYWLIQHGTKVLNNAITVGTYPLRKQFEDLTKAIETLNDNFKEQKEDLSDLKKEVKEHDKLLVNHTARINNLEVEERENN